MRTVDNDYLIKKCKRMMAVLCCLLLFGASISQAQDLGRKISLTCKDMPLTEALNQVERYSDFKLNFNYEELSRYRVNVVISKKTAPEAVDMLLQNTPFKKTVTGNFIVISRQRVVVQQRQTQGNGIVRIHGRVTDNTKNPLPGVNVMVKGYDFGAMTNSNGSYVLGVNAALKKITLFFTFIGMKTASIDVKLNSPDLQLDIIMEENASELGEVVVTGIFNKPRESYTGAASSYNHRQIESSGNRSIISTLRNLDPSFSIADNITAGSNPNDLPTITLRGASSLPTDVKDLQVSTENQRTANQPLFILDGFEISLSRFMDLDESQIESVTLLKDANATALYGSKGSNGVVVIVSKQIAPGKLRFGYKGTLSIEAPDLSSYNLMNASEKLQYEKLAGLYNTSNAIQDQDLKDLYNNRKLDVERGVDTYWMKYPIRTGVGSRHSVSVEGGDQNLRYGASLGYNNIAGAMKGSSRKVLNGNMFLLYRYKGFTFQNDLQITHTNATNSPYGSFSQYCALNSYFTPYDDNGNLKKILEDYYYQSTGLRNVVYNPLYDAYLPSKNTSRYTSIVNNFSVQWNILPELFVRGQFSYTKNYNRSDVYICSSNTMFDQYTDEDYSRKGRYTYGNGESNNYEGQFTLNYSKDFGKHQIFAGLGATIDESKSESYSVTGEGISVDNMDFLGMANQYLQDGRPSGSESISRDMGFLFSFRYTYDKRYFFDLNGKYDGSSQFGSNNHFAPFWSTGAGWNMHNEKFLAKYKWINIARLRASYGITGSQNFSSYLSIRTYQDFGGKSTQNWYGVYLLAYGNPDLQWQKSRQLNYGADFEFFNRRIQLSFDIYDKITDNLLADVNLPISSGFSSYKSNVGKVDNKGQELNISAQILRNTHQNLYVTLGLKAAHNSNTIKEISNSLKTLNDELSSQSSYNPSFLYKEGESLNTIYAVRSKGIDPSTGKEIFIKQDGTETFTWDAKDKVACGVAEPKVQGTINANVRWKGFSVNLIFGYRFGGHAYNTTLASKVENIVPSDNADKRVLYDRWKEPGDLAQFKSVSDRTATYATSRFIFKDNTFYCSAMNFGYEFQNAWLKKNLSISYLALNGYLEDLFWKSTIRRERGTDYPFSRKFSMSLTARF